MFLPEVARLNVYVDDPIIALRGSKFRRDIHAAMIMIIWSALGFSLSLRKAKRASVATWTSVHFTVVASPDDFTVIAQTKPALVEDAWQLVKECMASNVVGRKTLRSLAGKVSHIGSLIFALRPFCADLWAAIYSDPSTWAPRGCIWVRQIHHALIWINAFFEASGSRALSRHFSARAMFNRAGNIEIIMDASPWGLGAALFIDGMPLEYFCSIVDQHDVDVLGLTIGSCVAQQTVEALTVLVAMKMWFHRIEEQRCCIRIKSDSISALYMVANMSSKGRGCKIIARELALLFALQCHRPDILEHVPGICNKVADKLSRKYEPGHHFQLPPVLAAASEVFPEVRGPKFYSTLAEPPSFSTPARAAIG